MGAEPTATLGPLRKVACSAFNMQTIRCIIPCCLTRPFQAFDYEVNTSSTASFYVLIVNAVFDPTFPGSKRALLMQQASLRQGFRYCNAIEMAPLTCRSAGHLHSIVFYSHPTNATVPPNCAPVALHALQPRSKQVRPFPDYTPSPSHVPTFGRHFPVIPTRISSSSRNSSALPLTTTKRACLLAIFPSSNFPATAAFLLRFRSSSFIFA
jgi:hypothetical protein